MNACHFLFVYLDFEFEDPDITEKRKEIEKCLSNPDVVNLEQWVHFAKSKAGLICGKSVFYYQ